MGTVVLGKQGSGKTSFLAGYLVKYAKANPTHPIFVFDPSGSLTDDLLSIILQEDEPERSRLLDRIIYDEIGNPEVVLPLPEFSPAYGEPEEQVSRVVQNMVKLAPALILQAPFVAGLSLQEIAPQILRLLTRCRAGVVNEREECWQITEAKQLLVDLELLKALSAEYGGGVPQAKWFLENVFVCMSSYERELRSYALLASLEPVEATPEIRARYGYYKPAWTPKEAIERGKIVILDGSRLNNRQGEQHYAFTQVFSLIIAEVNRRRPHDPNALPVTLVMDEVYAFFQIPGMAVEIGRLPSLYRSRRLQPFFVAQTLAQFEKVLREHLWTVGNVVAFALASFDDAYEVAQQLFRYEPQEIKLEGKTEAQHPIIESDRGQYLQVANWIQRLGHRECVIRRHLTEQNLDPYLRHLPRTPDLPHRRPVLPQEVEEVKSLLLGRHGVRVRDALKVIQERLEGGERLKEQRRERKGRRPTLRPG
jgi:hypothetical protein